VTPECTVKESGRARCRFLQSWRLWSGRILRATLLSFSLIATAAIGMDSQYYRLSPPTLPNTQSDQESSRQSRECKVQQILLQRTSFAMGKSGLDKVLDEVLHLTEIERSHGRKIGDNIG
jgi:hypothetical protein